MKNHTKIIARVVALLIVVAAGAMLIVGCASGPGSRAGESQFPTTAKASELAPSAASQARADVADAADLSELPTEVQVYTSMASDLVRNGTVPRDAVTVQAVQDDVAREYGITLTAAEADTVVRAILS